MTSGKAKHQIEELEKLRTQMRWWKLGVTFASLIVVAVSALIIRNSFRALLFEGPQQKKFIAQLNDGLKDDVVPQLQSIAGSTLTKLQPKVSASFNKVNNRVPEISQATMKEIDLLQKSLPERTEKSLNETFGKMLAGKHDKIKEMFPDATEDQVEKLLTNLGEQGKEQVKLANQELFAAHQQELTDIVNYMNQIKTAEAKNIQGVDPTWEMGILVLEIFKSDLEQLRPDKKAEAKKKEAK